MPWDHFFEIRGSNFFWKNQFSSKSNIFEILEILKNFVFSVFLDFGGVLAPGGMTRLWKIKFGKNLTKFHQNPNDFELFEADFLIFMIFSGQLLAGPSIRKPRYTRIMYVHHLLSLLVFF